MKNRILHNLPGLIAIIILLLIPHSCLDYNVNTTINRDGSLVREYTVRGDSSDLFKGSLMIPSGNLWKITCGYEPKDKQNDASEKEYYYKASRKFKNVREFNEWLSSDTASGTIKIKVNLERHFRWFYTYYEYTERYPMSFPFRNAPVDSFLTTIEQSFLAEDGRIAYSPVEKKWIWKTDTMEFQYNHQDSIEKKNMDDHCDKKLELWMVTAIVSEFADIVKHNFIHDSTFSDISQKLSRHIGNIQYQMYMSNDSTLIRSLILMVDSLTQCRKLSDLYERNPLIFNDFKNKLRTVDEHDYTDEYVCNLSMPGQTYSTNAFQRGPIQLKWKFGPMQFFMKDFEMKAESRVANPWIMILTGLVAVMMIFILVVRRRG